MQSIRKIVLARMEEKGITANAIGDLAKGKITKTHLYKYLKGKSAMSDRYLEIIFSILDLTIVPSERRPPR